MKNLKILLLLICLGFAQAQAKSTTKHVSIVVPVKCHPRILFGAGQLVKAYTKAGYDAVITHQNTVPSGWAVVVGLTSDQLVAKSTAAWHLPIHATAAGRTIIAGNWIACDLFSLLTLAIVLGLSILSFRYVEKPARLWSRRVLNPNHSEKVTPRDPTAAF